MLPQKNRLPSEEFKTRSRKTLSTPYFLAKFSTNHEGNNRFGFIISTSAIKKSVDRHYWKRRLSEYVQKWRNISCDFLIIVSPRIRDADEQSVKREAEKIFDIASRTQETVGSR